MNSHKIDSYGKISKLIPVSTNLLFWHVFSNWWPMFVLFFYFLVPVPTVISRRMAGSFDSASSACVELCIFLTTGIVISALGLPIILARASVVSPFFWTPKMISVITLKSNKEVFQ